MHFGQGDEAVGNVGDFYHEGHEEREDSRSEVLKRKKLEKQIWIVGLSERGNFYHEEHEAKWRSQKVKKKE